VPNDVTTAKPPPAIIIIIIIIIRRWPYEGRKWQIGLIDSMTPSLSSTDMDVVCETYRHYDISVPK